MKILILLFILTVTTFAQTPDPLAELDKLRDSQTKPERKHSTSKWEYITSVSLLGPVDVYNDRISIWDGLSHAWIKMVIRKPQRWSAKSKMFRGVNYFLQYATADCQKQRLTRESTTFYDQKNSPMMIPGDFMVDSVNKPVIPLSVDGFILDKFCNE